VVNGFIARRALNEIYALQRLEKFDFRSPNKLEKATFSSARAKKDILRRVIHPKTFRHFLLVLLGQSCQDLV